MMILDRMFWWAAMVMGVASGLGTTVFGLLSIAMWVGRPAPTSPGDPRMSESLVGLMVLAAGWVVKVLGAILGLVEGLMRFATALSFCGLLFAAVLWWISRGLAEQALWAKIVASGMLAVGVLVGGLLSLSAGAGLFRLGGVGVAGFCGYAIWLAWKGVA